MVLKNSIALAIAIATTVLQAHDSPSHTIKELNHNQHLTPAQLHQRAVAQRSIGHIDLAIADLQAAILKEPKQLGHHLELAHTQLTAKRADQALQSADQALALSTTASERAIVHILYAEAYSLKKNDKKALQSIQRAFQEIPQGNIEWYLLRSQTQRHLQLKQERITDLETGLKHHPSAVLKSHWIDALIDNTQYSKALVEIDHELTDRRWKSSYLIKRARALTGLKRQPEAATDLNSAIAEITPRLNPQRPDIFLLAELAIAHSLLGNDQAAQAHRKQLQHHHAPQWILDQLQESLHPLHLQRR